MDLEEIKLSDIKYSDYNPRIMDEDESYYLKNSIDQFGFVDPIIVSLREDQYKIIGGHQRYDILLEKYMETGENEFLYLVRLGDIGWVFPEVDLTVKSDEHEKALNIALNKISGKWDEPKLEELLFELSESQLDFELTGFDESDIGELQFNVFDELITREDTQQESEVIPDSHRTVTLSYRVDFLNEEEENKWFDFLSIIKEKYPDVPTISERIIKAFEDILGV